MTADGKARDLEKDLVICAVTLPGPYELKTDGVVEVRKGNESIAFTKHRETAVFLAEARTGWPYAIRRVLAAEAEIDRLRNELNILQEQYAAKGGYRD